MVVIVICSPVYSFREDLKTAYGTIGEPTLSLLTPINISKLHILYINPDMFTHSRRACGALRSVLGHTK